MSSTPDIAPDSQVASMTWFDPAEVRDTPDAVIDRLLTLLDDAERRATEERVPGGIVLGVRVEFASGPPQ